MGSRENYFGLVARQNNYTVSLDKNIDHGVKETWAFMSTKVTYEIDHISLLPYSTISIVLNFCFLCILS